MFLKMLYTLCLAGWVANLARERCMQDFLTSPDRGGEVSAALLVLASWRVLPSVSITAWAALGAGLRADAAAAPAGGSLHCWCWCMQSYSASKLGNVLFTYESQRRMASLGIQVKRIRRTANAEAAELSAPRITASRPW